MATDLLRLFLLKLTLLAWVMVTSWPVEARLSEAEHIAQIYEAADLRNATAKAIQTGLTSNNIAIQKQAILALGRIGDPRTNKTLSAFLFSPQPEVRSLAAFALAISADNSAVPALINRLKTENSVVVIGEILPAIGILGPVDNAPDIIAVLLRYLDDSNSQIVNATCDGLSYAWSMHRSTISVPNSTQVYKLLSLAAEKPDVANHCLYALTRLRSEIALFDHERLMETRKTLKTDYQQQLMTMILGAQNNEKFLDYFVTQFHPDSSPDLMALAAQAIVTLPESDLTNKTIAALIRAETDYLKHDFIRIGLLDGLGQQEPGPRKSGLLKQLKNDPSEWVSSRAIAMLYATDKRQYSEDMRMLLKSNRITTQQVVLTVAKALATEENDPLLLKGKSSTFPSIRKYTETLIKADDTEEQTPLSETLTFNKIRPYIDRRMILETTKGTVTIQLLPSAPYTAHNFYQLATTGYYNGTEFHRVIPGFVVQGGDMKPESIDGTGYRIREELYPASHLKGTLGMASSGKDTAGGGFYFNLKDNYHLDRRYTIFGRVVDGMSVVNQLGVGDKILSIREQQALAR